MIEDIRNPWIRRTVLILTLVFYVPIGVAVRLCETLYECWLELYRDVPAAWRGHG